ncbi:dermonecrotic toxin domain-containing protein [Pseudomonas sp. W5-01]|uniref:dermonecrotic toxin domain-containing protein n=1 Tax=Pseudomonas sp. W5-01 TaxID=3097454 RepID=UPI00397C2327
MSTVTTTYFNSASLRRRFLEELDRAVTADLLVSFEQTWLKRAAGAPATDDADPVRVDRLLLNDGLPNSLELSAALMFSHGQTADPRVFLFTLASGVEAFEDRAQLLATLLRRFANDDPLASFEYEKIDGDAFQAQMEAIVEYQAHSVRQFTDQLKLIPDLIGAVNSSLALQLRRLLPDQQMDPATHLMRLVQPASSAEEELVFRTQTLVQTAYEAVCRAELDQGVTMQYLDAQGRVASDSDAALFAQAIRETIPAVPARFAQLLSDYWGQRHAAGSCRDMAMQIYATSLCHELYRYGHEANLTRREQALLRPLLVAGPRFTASDAEFHCSRLALHVPGAPAKPLAGTLVFDVSPAALPLLWFTPEHGLRRFANLTALSAFCSTPEGREMLRPTLALADQPLLLREGALSLSMQRISGPLLGERIDSILALQARNLQFVTGLSTESEMISAMYDDALDVRQLIDPRQLHFSAGRWRREQPMDFAAVWCSSANDDLVVAVTEPESIGSQLSASDPSQPTQLQPTPPSWLERTQVFDANAAHLRELDNVLAGYAEQALQRYLCVASARGLRASEVRVRWLESLPLGSSDVEPDSVAISETLSATSMDLVALLLERVSGHRCDPLESSAQVLLTAQAAGAHLDIELIRFMLKRVAADFIERYLDHFRRLRTGLARLGDRQLQPVAIALVLREDTLRLDLALRQRMEQVTSASASMVMQVLNAPVRAQRTEPGAPTTEVFAVSLVYGPQPGATLSDSMALWQPLALDAGVMFWSSQLGWEYFVSKQALSDKIGSRLRGAHSERWLALLGERDRVLLRSHLQAHPAGPIRIHFSHRAGHAIEALQQSVFDRQSQNLQQMCARARRCRFEAGLFTRLARATELDTQLIEMLDALSVRIDNTLFQELLPDWLKAASPNDLRAYNAIWRRFFLASDGEEDFLFDIPTLSDYARDRLLEQMRKDFPEHVLHPDEITVTQRRYVAAPTGVGQIPSGIPAATLVHSETLTDYAINRFSDIPDGVLSINDADDPEAARLITPDYLRSTVRKLDVGTGFRTLLRQTLNPADAKWVRRNKLFIDQLPPMMQAVAMQQKLEGQLSAEAYAFISRVVEMPDGIAREPVNGVRVIISALRLVADAGMTPDILKGIYLICAEAGASGPVILHAVFHRDFVFREYTSLSALEADIRSDASLQALLLQRVDPEVRKRYEHGGFIEPHLPFFAQGFGDVPTHTPGPVTVSLAEENGNSLQFMFTDTMSLLVDIGESDTVTNQEADHASRQFLASLGLEQALSVMPGKLGTMIALWQSHTLFRASAASASGRHWGEALSEFSAALGVMMTARDQAEKDELISADLVEGEEVPAPVFFWGGATLTGEQLTRLHALEARNVSLKDLRRDDLLSLFMNTENGRAYAAVSGRVYEVRRQAESGRWMIIGPDRSPGPCLKLDDRQRWQLDIESGLKGGGGAMTKLRTHAADVSADDVLLIEASGMADIRTFYRERAQRIGEAHLQAKRYLENALDNLNVHAPGTPLDPRVTQIIGDFFGVSEPGQELLVDTERAVKALFDEVMDASLSPYSSPRFVVGTNRPGREGTMGFVIKRDPKKRVFLTDRYFDAPPFPLKPEAANEGFDCPAHYRAATLIHELSHLVLDTHDIAYLESTSPYPDLLQENNAYNIKLKGDIERMQSSGLSHLSIKRELFLQLTDGEWRDFDEEESFEYDAILKLTKCKTLDDARDVFMSDAQKRSRVILANADSVTLLVLRLGRRSFVVPSPSPGGR